MFLHRIARDAYFRSPILGTELFLLSQCPPCFFKTALVPGRAQTEYLTTAYPEGVDMGPVCILMFGISQNSELKGGHTVDFHKGQGPLYRKQIRIHPFLDDFNRTAALLQEVFNHEELTYSIWLSALQCSSSTKPGEFISL